jgi:hypothetical protein
MWLDDELRRTLERVDPPAGFVERTLARRRLARGGPDRRPAHRARPPWTLVLGLAASLVATTALGLGYLHRAQQADASRARDEIRAALHLASVELNRVHRHVVRPDGTVAPEVGGRR